MVRIGADVYWEHTEEKLRASETSSGKGENLPSKPSWRNLQAPRIALASSTAKTGMTQFHETHLKVGVVGKTAPGELTSIQLKGPVREKTFSS